MGSVERISIYTTFDPTFLREFLDPNQFMIYTLTRFPHGINLNLSLKNALHVFLISADQYNQESAHVFDIFWKQISELQNQDRPLIFLLPSSKPAGCFLPANVEQSFLQKIRETKAQHFNVESLIPYLTKNYFDLHNYFLTGSGYSKEFLEILSSCLLHLREFKQNLKKKLVIIDLDETMWPGILAEGKEGIYGTDEVEKKIFQQFQSEIKQLKLLGYVIAVCSKNNLKDVREILSGNFEVQIDMNDFILVSASWEPKDMQIANILLQTGFAEHQTVFIDNNIFERELVRKAFPNLTIFDFHASPIKRILSIKKYFGFYNPFLTDEDLVRTVLYQQNSKRTLLKNEVTQIDDWVKELNPVLSAINVDDKNIQRARQLMLRTNQFNINSDKTNADRYFAEWKQAQRIIKLFSYQDRFGDDGIIGLVSWVETNERLLIDQFILSCRVFGRKIEHAIINYVQTRAKKNKATPIYLKAIETEKNQVGIDFLNTSNLYTRVGQNEFKLNDETVIVGYQISVDEL